MNPLLDASAGRPDPLAGFDFVKLISSAAKLRPDRPALCDSALPGALSLTFAELERAVLHSATLWRDLDMPESACILVVAGARVAPVAAVLGALRAGLDVALVSSHLPAADIARIARETRAMVLCGEPANGGIAIADAIFAAAATVPDIRYVAMLTDRAVDGALTMDIKALRGRPAIGAPPASARRASVLTVASDGRLVRHTQHALISAAVDFIAEARISMRQPVISTISVASFAGLVCGPLAGFMSGAQTYLHGPFDSEGFRDLLSFNRQANLVVPASIAQAVIDAGLCEGPEVGALVLLTRLADRQPQARPDLRLAADSHIVIVDLFATEETSVLAERRGAGAAVRPAPLREAGDYAIERRRQREV